LKGSETDSLAPKVLTTTNFVVLVIYVIYDITKLPLLELSLRESESILLRL
jgi:hypothetical protein